MTLEILENKVLRRQIMEKFVTDSGWKSADISFLAGDASFRSYDRVRAGNRQAVLMDAPPEKEDMRPFIHVDHYLRSHGFSAPEILAQDMENGFLLLEDFGDDSYTKLLTKTPEVEKELYIKAIELLAELYRKPADSDLAAYDHATYMREVGLFAEWYLPAVAGNNAQALAREFMDLWDELLRKHPPVQQITVLRDYHADNLLWLPERQGVAKVGLLDFQDALIGHPAYDIVSLLEDARRDVQPNTVKTALEHYLELTRQEVEEFKAFYALLGAQRNAKIIGIFVRLAVRDGKKHYPRYLPRVWGHFLQDLQHPWLAPMGDWISRNIRPEWQGALAL